MTDPTLSPRQVAEHWSCSDGEVRLLMRNGSLRHFRIGRLYRDEDGLALDSPTVTKRFQRTLEAAGLPRVTFHSLRHSAATLMIEAGVDLATVAAILGHSTIVTTVNTYAHVTAKHRQAALGTLMERIG